MNPTVGDVFSKIDDFAPFEQAFEWDNCGLIVGSAKKRVSKVLVALDVCTSTLRQAIEKEVDLILTHHPSIFKPLSAISDPLIIGLIKNDIAVISAHTNLDVAVGGVNYALAEKLGFYDVEPIYQKEKIAFVVCSTPIKTPTDFAKEVKHKLGAPYVQLYSPLDCQDKQIKKVGLCGGVGGDYCNIANDVCDIFVSSEFGYHRVISSPIFLLDVGHFYSEFPALKIFDRLLSDFEIKVFYQDPKSFEINNYEVF